MSFGDGRLWSWLIIDQVWSILPAYEFLPSTGHGDVIIMWNYFVTNSALILFLLLIPTQCFRFLIDKVNCIKSLESFKSNLMTISQHRLSLRQLIIISPYAFYYMAVIFFGLKIDLGNFNIRGSLNNISWHKKIGVMFILLIYSCGLVCTAYIANYIIQS